jgi:protein SCO1/2
VSKKALLALCIVILTPLVFFSITNYKSKNAVVMPRRYYFDTVTNVLKDGKEFSDTVWHKVANISLTNQLGKPVSLDQLKNQVIVADFFFTHCGSICPSLTRNIKKMQDAIKPPDPLSEADSPFVHFLSFSVDPVRDSVPVLKKYADKYGVNPDKWWLLTGPKKEIYDFAMNELKLGVADEPGVDTAFIHTEKMVLLDKHHLVRGYYNGLDSADLSRLAQDLVWLNLEKDKNSPSIFGELRPLLPVFVVALLAIVAILYFMNRRPANRRAEGN